MGEEIFSSNNSRKLYFSVYLMMVIVIALIIYILVKHLEVNEYSLTGAIMFVLLGILFTEIHRKLVCYKITPLYLIHIKGILSKRSKKILIESIVDIDINQGPWQRFLNYGDVDVHAASGANIIKIKNINKPEAFVDILEKQVGQILNKGKKKGLKWGVR